MLRRQLQYEGGRSALRKNFPLKLVTANVCGTPRMCQAVSEPGITSFNPHNSGRAAPLPSWFTGGEAQAED